METHTLFATLIGINAYSQTPLSGCIKDVLDIDLLLRELCEQQPEKLDYQPYYLLAPNTTDRLRIADYTAEKQVTISLEDAPTFDNISSKAFAHLKQAKDGDICLLYYSGHGSQVDAPEPFWHSKPDRQNETLVCVDSRDPANPGARDLVDKELAYLIWGALEGKNVHCLVIMDCCHSGNNMRALVESDDAITYRFISSARNNVPLEKYLGFDKGFYELTDGKANIKIARYVHLAAARDSEKAQETKTGGLFTSKLTEVLRSGGTAKSYREIMQGLTIDVRNRAEQQNPVPFATIDADLDQQFLGKKLLPYTPSFDVRYDFNRKQWLLFGGAMHNITPSGPQARTIIRIAGYDQDIDVIAVFPNFSVLDEKATLGLDTRKTDYRATLQKLANSIISIGISRGLASSNQLFDTLKNAWQQEPHLYFSLDIDDASPAHEYLVQLTTNDEFVLTRSNSNVPLFKREKDAASFLRNVDAVGKWISASELKNANTAIQKDDFVFTTETIEGESLSLANLDQVKGEITPVQPEEEIVLSYKNGQQPAFRFSIGLSQKSSLQNCYVAALYLESKYGIRQDLVRDNGIQLVKNGNPLDLTVLIQNRFYRTFPLGLDDRYKLYNINEITEILKIFVSNQPIDLQRFKQDGLALDDQPNIQLREIGLNKATPPDNVGDETDWTVFTFKIRLVGPNKSQELEPGKAADFTAFTVEVPDGFGAHAFAVTGNDQQKKLHTASLRGIDPEVDVMAANIFPPAAIWGDAITDVSPFPKGLSAYSDNGIQALELLPSAANGSIILPEGKEMIIKPKQAPASARSADELEATIVPFGYDEALQLYIPLGYSDEEGNIHIQQLPPETAGRIQTDEPLTRSLGGSIKLFFKKLFRKKQLNSLVLYQYNNSAWQQISDDPNGMQSLLQQKATGSVLLLIHGLTGDTRHMMGCLQEMPELPAQADFILTFDYENLATPIKKTAADLNATLRGAGFGNPGMPSLTIIAHSQGGLVARWLAEKETGSDYIKHLVLVATASAGSELAKLGSAVFSMLTHALNVTGPLKYAITGLSFLLKKLELNPGETLKETNPGSDAIIELSKSALPGHVQYSVIGGDTNLLRTYTGDDYFLKKAAQALVKDIVYPGLTLGLYKNKPNDMAVTIESMEAIPGFDTNGMRIVASNHLAYFRENLCRKALLEFLRES